MYTRPSRVAVILGVGGQDGYLASGKLRSLGYYTIGVARNKSLRSDYLLETGVLNDLFYLDLSISEHMLAFVSDIRPSLLLDFTLPSKTNWKTDVSEETFFAVTAIPRALFELTKSSLIARFKNFKILVTSSSEIFPKDGRAKDLSDCKQTRTAYSKAKLWIHNQSEELRKSGYPIYTPVMFPHESPLRDSAFLTKKILMSLYKLKSGESLITKLENFNSYRDWSWAPCIIDTCLNALLDDQPHSFVTGSGVSLSVHDLLTLASATLELDIEIGAFFTENSNLKRANEDLGHFAKSSGSSYVSQDNSLKFHMEDYFVELDALLKLGLC